MKKLYFNTSSSILSKVASLAVLLFLALHLTAGEKQDFTKNINKEFSINPTEGTVVLYNKYGKIDVKTTNTDKVKIDVSIIVKARNEKDANDMFEKIQIDFFNDNNLVKAQTQISSSSSWGFDWNNNNDFTINYLVSMPKTCRLELANRYGDSYIAPLEGSAQLDVKYGNFNMEKITGKLCITLGYGNGTVNSAGYVNAGVSYGNLTLHSASKMEIETKYSNVNIKKINEIATGSKYSNFTLGEVYKLSNEGKYDKYDISSINELFVNTAYTDVKIDNLIQLANVEMSYGKLIIKQLTDKFKAVNFSGKYADCILHNPNNVAYIVSAKLKYGDAIAPVGFDYAKDQSDNNSKFVEGYFGSRNAISRVNVDIQYGNLKMK